MSILSRLFGSKSGPKTVEPVEYNGFRIYPTPEKDGSQYRIMARIEMDIEGETQSHSLIRADTIADLDEATQATIAKAQQVIDEQGVRLFQQGRHS